MFSNLLKRFRPATASRPESAQASSRPSPRPSPISPASPPEAVPEAVDWTRRLAQAQAQGDDAALLVLAKESPRHALRLSAIQSLRDPAALQQAAQTFRGHDKTLYRAAQTALDTQRRRQETQTAASQLLDEANALLREAATTPLPANRLVELDQAWDRLDAALIDEAPRAEFPRLYAELRQRSQEHLERQRDEQRRQEAAAAEKAAQEAAHRAEEEATRQRTEAALATEQQQKRNARRQAHEQTIRQHQQARQKLQALEDALSEGEVSVSVAEKELALLRPNIQGLDDEALQTRLQAAQVEIHRLKSWQNWGGLQAREALLQEAETLAQATTGEEATLPASATKQHAQTIERLRKQWKKLDQLGSPSNQTLWQRFDAALKTAWQPVALQKQKLGESRQENLKNRLTLLTSLDTFPMPEDCATSEGAAAHPSGNIDWRALLQTLAGFRTAWRKLGPIEHTVPHAEHAALQTHLNRALARLETPLEAAREETRRIRHALIGQAQTLARPPLPREAARRVRELQNQWREKAQTSAHPPLPHKEENGLWETFKAATDAVFAQLHEAHQLQQTRQQAHQSDREALISELAALLESPALETLPRRLGELETRWRMADNLPKPLAARLETAWRETHRQVQHHLATLHQQQWQTACDDLLARLEYCEALEEADDPAHAPESGPLPAPAKLPALWLQALQQRQTNAATAPVLRDEAALDHALLQAEASLELPSPAGFESARQQLRLQTMKRAMEHRQTTSNNPLALIAELLRQPASTPLQRERLRSVLSSLRTAPPKSIHS